MDRSHQAAVLSIEQQHSAIIACGGDLLATLRRGGSTAEIGQIRMRLAGLLHANLASEEAQLTGPLRRLAKADRPHQFALMAQEAADLRNRYSEHVGRWTLSAIANDRQGYTQDASELVRQMREHLQKKASLLPAWRRALI